MCGTARGPNAAINSRNVLASPALLPYLSHHERDALKRIGWNRDKVKNGYNFLCLSTQCLSSLHSLRVCT